jgi:hypothetical protein
MSADKNITDLEPETSASFEPLRLRELTLKEREIAIKERELRQSKWANPLVVGVLAAAVGLLGNAWVAYLNNHATQKLERLREQSNLIVEVVKTGNPEDACNNLNFFVKMNLVDDPSGAISKCKSNPTVTPVLPSQALGTEEGPQLKPGTERWPVKTGSDADAAQVGEKQFVDRQGLSMDRDGSVHSSVEQLVSLPRPSDMPTTGAFSATYMNHRAAPVEFILWTVEANLIAFKLEADGDYHIVIQGDSGETMVVEIPNPVSPFVDPKSRWAQQIASARKAVDDRFTAQRIVKTTNTRIRITGVGFFDRVHGQIGMTTNGIELHPVTHIEFLQ